MLTMYTHLKSVSEFVFQISSHKHLYKVKYVLLLKQSASSKTHKLGCMVN